MRSPKAQRAYDRHLKNIPAHIPCEFCDINPSYPQFVSETKSFKVFTNIFPYSTWDSLHTADHLLVIPKKHIDKLADLSASEAVEFMNIIGSYEIQGYNIYARAPQTAVKSIVHQHTHLIKPKPGKPHKFMFYMKRPYFRIAR